MMMGASLQIEENMDYLNKYINMEDRLSYNEVKRKIPRSPRNYWLIISISDVL